MQRNDGILEVTLHSDDGPVVWGAGPHRECGTAFGDIAADPGNRVVIFTGSGSEFIAREACLAALVSEVQSQRVDRLVLESRQDDREDARIISKLRQPEPPLVFEHRTARREAMLGIADGITWAAGAGAHWQALIEPLVQRVIELRP